MARDHFMREAKKREDSYLLTTSAADLVLYSSRLILAYNRILYPYKKWLMIEVAQAPEKPADFLELAQRLLQERTCEAGDALWKSVNEFQDWGIPWETVVTRFTLDVEWGWRSGHLGLPES